VRRSGRGCAAGVWPCRGAAAFQAGRAPSARCGGAWRFNPRFWAGVRGSGCYRRSARTAAGRGAMVQGDGRCRPETEFPGSQLACQLDCSSTRGASKRILYPPWWPLHEIPTSHPPILVISPSWALQCQCSAVVVSYVGHYCSSFFVYRTAGQPTTPIFLLRKSAPVNSQKRRHTKRILYQKPQTQRALPLLSEAPRRNP
jgi:hypothetical protein